VCQDYSKLKVGRFLRHGVFVNLLWPPYGIGQAIIFSSCGFSIFFFSSPNLSGHTLDVYHASTRDVVLVRIYYAGLKCAGRAHWKYRTQKIAIWAPSHNFVGPYLRNQSMYRQSEKKLVKQQYVLHMFSQYGELWPTSG